MYTAYRISSNYYGGKLDPVSGTGQEIKLSGDIYRDKSYLIIKVPERHRLRVLIKTQITKKKIQELYIGFIDNTNFFICGDQFQR